MPNYVAKQLARYKQLLPKRPQHYPYEPSPINYGKKSDDIIQRNKYVQQVVSSSLSYARAIDNTILLALSAVVSNQANPAGATMKRVHQLLDNMACHPKAVI